MPLDAAGQRCEREGRASSTKGPRPASETSHESAATCLDCRNFPYPAVVVVGRCGIDVDIEQVATAVAEWRRGAIAWKVAAVMD